MKEFRVLLILLLLCFTASAGYSQRHDLIIRRVDSLNRESWRNERNAPQKSLSQAKEALRLSHQENYLKGQAWALRHIANYHQRRFENDTATTLIDSAIRIMEKDTLRWDKARFYTNKAVLLTRTGEIEEANRFIDSAMKYLPHSSPLIKASSAYFLNYLKARNYDRTGQMSLALKFYLIALEEAEKRDQKQGMMDIYFNRVAM